MAARRSVMESYLSAATPSSTFGRMLAAIPRMANDIKQSPTSTLSRYAIYAATGVLVTYLLPTQSLSAFSFRALQCYFGATSVVICNTRQGTDVANPAAEKSIDDFVKTGIEKCSRACRR